MRALICILAVALLVVLRAAGDEAKELRVCADPNNLPFSNEKQEGIENKIAEVIANDLGYRLVYTFWPHQRGLVKKVLNQGKCDVLIGIPKGYDPVLWTKPYYRSGYVIAVRKDGGPKITSLDDPALRKLRIGVLVNTPPHDALGQRGIVGDNVVGYQLMFDSQSHPEDYPGKVMEDLVAGKIDVALEWGPIAGYFAKKRSANVVLTPIEGNGDPGARFAFDVSMGVRKADKELRDQLDQALDRRQAEIRRILEDFGVPLLPARDDRGPPR